MKINKTASVKMQWDTFTFPIKIGTPISSNGVLANNAEAFGLVVRTVNSKPDADELLYVMTDGIIDMEDIVAGFGTQLTEEAITALGGIDFFNEGKNLNVIAGKVNDIEDWHVLNETYNVRYRKWGHIVEVRINLSGTATLAAETELGVLPYEYRPQYDTRVLNYNGTGCLQVHHNGKVFWITNDTAWATVFMVYTVNI